MSVQYQARDLHHAVRRAGRLLRGLYREGDLVVMKTKIGEVFIDVAYKPGLYGASETCAFANGPGGIITPDVFRQVREYVSTRVNSLRYSCGRFVSTGWENTGIPFLYRDFRSMYGEETQVDRDVCSILGVHPREGRDTWIQARGERDTKVFEDAFYHLEGRASFRGVSHSGYDILGTKAVSVVLESRLDGDHIAVIISPYLYVGFLSMRALGRFLGEVSGLQLKGSTWQAGVSGTTPSRLFRGGSLDDVV